ncbi:hypothetical protein N5923_16280 [Erwiniaceae bacterium BAC15a-03b]|uniref:Uncharacterized protein n=1 Tax=Winslowiella arboricola TaxID=2978220 RepID=A0A9J6PW30_9GAMM|nr:hypothetical protein [Winslowiella arboricola]MCU5772522.1 hypothetical protein [Winslowiella arboricola]MCU5779044.1 hypothetical protein [Winslowiella arboricola]
MGFRDVKREAIRCLLEGAYHHEIRVDIAVKNVFSTGLIDQAGVIELIRKTSGDEYLCTPHHQDADIDVHILRPWKAGCRWYVKFYFIQPNLIFISVHL